MPFPTPLHDRTFALCESLNYRDWAGYYAAESYEPQHEHEYHAIRHAAGLTDISPLFKYLVSGRDAVRLIDRVITRDASRMHVGQVIYTPWCDEHGRVIDDGTISRIDDGRFRWTAAEPNLRWLLANASGLDVHVEDVSEQTSALALQGPMSAAILREVSDADIDGLKYFHVGEGRIAGHRVEISRTGYTGDLGYEIWVDAAGACGVWDALIGTSATFALKPAGLLALDVARIEAGLRLIDVDFFSVRKALIASRWYTPFEMGLGRLVDFGKARFIGRQALIAERDRGPRRRIVGLTIDWNDIEAIYASLKLPPLAGPAASRLAVPVFRHGRQVGRMTSSTWSPVLKQMIGLATVDAGYAQAGTPLEVEHSVDAVRRLVGAAVTPTPFFNPPRKTGMPP